jgi:hypothetical protein
MAADLTRSVLRLIDIYSFFFYSKPDAPKGTLIRSPRCCGLLVCTMTADARGSLGKRPAPPSPYHAGWADGETTVTPIPNRSPHNCHGIDNGGIRLCREVNGIEATLISEIR